MKITFRFTDKEYLEIRRLNKHLASPQWKNYLLTTLCLVPSCLLLLLTYSYWLISVGVMILSLMLALSILSLIRSKKLSDKHDHHLTLTPDSRHELTSHSETEASWDIYQEFKETPKFLMFRHLQRYFAIPKRAVSENEYNKIKEIGERINSKPDENDAEKASTSVPPDVNELYLRAFPNPESEDIYRFQYEQTDLPNAASELLAAVDLDAPLNKNKNNKKKRSLISSLAWLVVALAFFIYAAFRTAPPNDPWTIKDLILLALAIAAPFFFVLSLNKWLKSRHKKSIPEIHREILDTQLSKTGWAIGNPRSCQFFDWRDITGFHQNRFCIGLRTFDDLLQVIPKRIFADEAEAENFLLQAIAYRREHLRSLEAQQIVAVETGNPFQAPSSRSDS